MKCPHCSTGIHENWTSTGTLQPNEADFYLQWMACPACSLTIIRVMRDDRKGQRASWFAYPRSFTRPVPSEVEASISQDFKESCAVLPLSAQASAAISRRLLQRILREHAGVKKGDLADEIAEAIPKLPTHIGEGLHVLRTIGNFAAHPNKSAHTGAILPVEPGEAEWCLDVLEGLFDHFFVQPARLAAMKANLNAKLQAANRKPLP